MAAPGRLRSSSLDDAAKVIAFSCPSSFLGESSILSRADQSDEKSSDAQLESTDNGELPKAIDKALASGQPAQMRSELDDLPATKAYRIYWRISLICMLAAFSAALEGYRAYARSSRPRYSMPG